jgi:hypothetical protein
MDGTNSIIEITTKGNDLMSRRIFLLAVGLLVLLATGAVLTSAQFIDSRELPDKINPDDEPGVAPSVITELVDANTRTYSVNPGGFLFNSDSTDITMSIYYGLRWAANTSERGGFYMQRPADWDGLTPVVVTITFALGNNQAGTVNWTLRLNTYTPNSGEWLTNPASRDADTILTFPDGPSSLGIYSQTFTIPGEDFFEEPYWSFFFVRGSGSNGETFTGNLYVMGVDVAYNVAP